MIMCGGDKKRERKVPDRYRDAMHSKLLAGVPSWDDEEDYLEPELLLTTTDHQQLPKRLDSPPPVEKPPDVPDNVQSTDVIAFDCNEDTDRSGSPPHPVEMEQGTYQLDELVSIDASIMYIIRF